MSAIYNEELTYETGSQTVYSDLSMILVAEAIERITNQSLDDFVKERIFQPLGMVRTGFFRQAESNFVGKALRSECGPTETIEPWRRQLRLERYGPEGSANLFGKNPRYIQGEVHDPTATVLDGVAGHAGLFSTIQDLTRFLTHYMNRESSIVQPEVWDLFTKQQNPKSTRGLGWDTKSPEGSSAGTKFGPNSYGHTGYTGTSIWVDPDARLFAILLTNRVHPTSENAKLLAFRPKFHDQCWELLNHSGKQNELI
jgi:CubicO group peptidase (beta-lactamase class C family)